MELQITRLVEGKDQPRQHGILSWCFVQALEELRYDCTHVELMEVIKKHMKQIKERDLPRMDQEVLLTFSTPLSNPSRMRALQPVEALHAFNHIRGGCSEPSWASQPSIG